MEPLTPRLIRPVPHPLAVYLRPDYSCHRKVGELLASGVPAALEGVVFDASLADRQEELRQEAVSRRIESVLDLKMMELATQGGFARYSGRGLAWAGDMPHTVESLRPLRTRKASMSAIVECVARGRFTAVLAPTHLLHGSQDPWFALDRESTFLLREELDKAGLRETLIYYPLALPMRVFGDQSLRAPLRVAVSTLPIDGIWLRIHPFGAQSGATSVRRYIEACRDFHQERPLVSESVGPEGLALLSFGAVGGIAIGIASGEHFDAGLLLRLPRPRTSKFGPKRRIYIPELQAYLPADKATQFFETRGMKALFGCKEQTCCRLGVQDMLRDPRNHFMRRRLGEVARLGQLPEPLRANRYLEEILRPATDRMVRAVKVDPSLERQRHRLENLRVALGALQEDVSMSTCSVPARGQRIQIRRGA